MGRRRRPRFGWGGRPDSYGGAISPRAAAKAKPKPRPRPRNYVVTPTGAIGVNTQQAMEGLVSGSYTTNAQGQAVPVKPSPQTQPFDPQYEASRVSGMRNLAVGDLRAEYDRQRIRQEYGFDDLSNPYSRANLAAENYARSLRGTTNSMASQGQLYSGATQRMQRENFRNYDITRDQLRREYDDLLGNIEFGRLENYANYGIGMDDAAFQKLLDDLKRRP